METQDYVPIVSAGADGLVVYQETYNRGVYAEAVTALNDDRRITFISVCAEPTYRGNQQNECGEDQPSEVLPQHLGPR